MKTLNEYIDAWAELSNLGTKLGMRFKERPSIEEARTAVNTIQQYLIRGLGEYVNKREYLKKRIAENILPVKEEDTKIIKRVSKSNVPATHYRGGSWAIYKDKATKKMFDCVAAISSLEQSTNRFYFSAKEVADIIGVVVSKNIHSSLRANVRHGYITKKGLKYKITKKGKDLITV